MNPRWRARRLSEPDPAPDCLELAEGVSRHLRSGATLSESLRRATGVHARSWLGDVMANVRRGESLASCLEERLHVESRRRRPDGDLVLTLQVLALAARVGGEPSRHVDSLSETLRARRSARADRLTQASTARASIRLLTWLPIVCALWMIADDPDVRRLLTTTPIGWTCIGVGVAFNVVGRRWTARLVART